MLTISKLILKVDVTCCFIDATVVHKMSDSAYVSESCAFLINDRFKNKRTHHVTYLCIYLIARRFVTGFTCLFSLGRYFHYRVTYTTTETCNCKFSLAAE